MGLRALFGAGALLCLGRRRQAGRPQRPRRRRPRRWSPEPPLVAYPPVTPWTSWSAHSITELRHLKTATGSPRLPDAEPVVSARSLPGHDHPRSNSSRSCTRSTIPSPPSRPTSTSTTRASSSIPRRRTGSIPQFVAPVRAAQPAPRADALVPHAGGIPRRVAPARQAAQRPARRDRSRPHRRPVGADGGTQHALSRQRAGAGGRSQPDHRRACSSRN